MPPELFEDPNPMITDETPPDTPLVFAGSYWRMFGTCIWCDLVETSSRLALTLVNWLEHVFGLDTPVLNWCVHERHSAPSICASSVHYWSPLVRNGRVGKHPSVI